MDASDVTNGRPDIALPIIFGMPSWAFLFVLSLVGFIAAGAVHIKIFSGKIELDTESEPVLKKQAKN
jgi:hypothetical protein